MYYTPGYIKTLILLYHFYNMYLGVQEFTVVEKIWAIIMEVVAIVAELSWADSDELTILIIENDKRLAALRAYAQTA